MSEQRVFDSELQMVAEQSGFVTMVRGPYVILSRDALSEQEGTSIIQTLRGRNAKEAAVRVEPGVLGGRSASARCFLPSVGSVFVKHYSHGGLLRSITGGYFLGAGKPRSQVEFEMLETVRAMGVHAPRPIAIVQRGALVYETWLLMEEIPDTLSLVDLQNDDSGLYQAMKSLTKQVLQLVKNKILHVDLHPGNVLVEPSGKVSIIDFDKAGHYQGEEHQLRDLYIRRWRRAVIKHRLSPVLSEHMALALRSHDE
jgi:3-deoxy-D-manno-octulosonic acid kinase